MWQFIDMSLTTDTLLNALFMLYGKINQCLTNAEVDIFCESPVI